MHSKPNKKKKKTITLPNSNSEQHLLNLPIKAALKQNEETLKDILNQCSDLVFRPFRIEGQTLALLVYLDGLADTKLIDAMLLKPLMYDSKTCTGYLEQMDKLENEAISIGQSKRSETFESIVSGILYGEAAVFLEGQSTAILLDVKGWKTRGIEEPASESVIRGPREGFIESIRTNTSLLRRRLRTPDLKMEALNIGTYSKTEIVITYIEGLAKDALVQEVRDRLNRIEIDGILESGYVEELIEDAPYSPFPTIQNTERPDTVVGNLLEGKVAILVDNTPFALIVPFSFWGALNSNEDYYERFWIGSFIRWIRYIALTTSLLLPSLYVGITTFHQEMLPTTLMLSVAATRENVPFPALVEALAMEFTFEVLREAGLRLPRQIGQAVSIVGALVIGQAAVEAGIVSAPMVIVVAVTGIASFTIPQFSVGISFRLLRFPLILMAGMFGLYGLTICVLFIIIHLCALRSFGSAYFEPVGPLNLAGLKDVFIRSPWWAMNQQSQHISTGPKPGPEQGKHGKDPS